MILLPRLPGPTAEEIVRRFLEHGAENWTGFSARNLPDAVRYAATGGKPITERQLADLRRHLEALARQHGFGATSSRDAFARFDGAASEWLAQSELFDSGEALRDDAWSFVGAVLAPDIVHWRFGPAIERYLGGVRNLFQRLWMRGRALDRGPTHPERWQLLKELTEDALVQITERPSIGGDPTLALAVGEAWVRAARWVGTASMERTMRRVILRVRIRNEIRSLSELPGPELSAFLDEEFRVAVESLRVEGS